MEGFAGVYGHRIRLFDALRVIAKRYDEAIQAIKQMVWTASCLAVTQSGRWEGLLFHNEFLCQFSHGNEIHSSRQMLDINPLGFSINGTFQQGLSHQVGDAVGWVW